MNSTQTKHQTVIIIGAGFGGLSAAAFLAHAGFKVTVLEKNESFGGRASVWKSKGFTFDMGPSWYLMPDAFERFFDAFNKNPSDYYKLVKLDPLYRIFFDKDDIIDISVDLNTNLKLFDELQAEGGLKLQRYLKRAERLYTVAMKEFLYRDYRSLLSFLKPGIIKGGLRMGNFFSPLDKTVSKYFSSDKAKKILEYSMVFLGSDPKNIPSLYSLMSYVDLKLGVWYPEGGIGEIPKAIYDLARSLDVEFHFNEEVRKIEVNRKEARQVISDQESYEADIVLVNADYAYAEMNLLDRKYQTYQAEYWKKRTIAPSTFLIYLGINKKISNLAHHNLVLLDWEEHFASIFKKPNWPENPSYYVCVPSKIDSSVAPPDTENLFILVPVASELTDSDKIREKYSVKILNHLENLIGESIRDSIIVKRIFSQQDFSDRYNAYKGTALGLSHTLKQTALWRPSHRSKKVTNLYYTGQYTHPGIGVPMTLISSQVVSEEIIKRYANS